MYYEERIINGVLSWRNTPDGQWTPFTAKQLTNKLSVALIFIGENNNEQLLPG
jgi:hypothetical protein